MELSDSEEINALLSYQPHSVQAPPTSVNENSPTTALSFYDMHLSSNLSLQRVVHLPTLLQDLTRVVDTYLGSTAVHASLPKITIGDRFPSSSQRLRLRADTKSTDVVSIAKLYRETTASNCEAVASTMILAPKCSSWMPSVTFSSTYNKDNPTDQAFTLEEYSLSLLTSDGDIYLYPIVRECLDQEKIRLLRTLWKKDPCLATWEFLPYTTQAITVIQNLCHGTSSHVRGTDVFHMRTYPPLGSFEEILATVPPDAEDTPWHLQDLRGNASPKQASSTNQERYPSVHTAVLPLNTQMSLVEQVIQHAWVTACRRDSTFIVLQCGNYERIGIRHRASQTLYLSDVIEVPTMTDHGTYTKLHLSLYISILWDAMQRAVHVPQGDAPMLPQKRRQGESGSSPRPRQRLRSDHATRLPDDEEDVTTNADSPSNISSRNLLLVSLQYGAYSSPNPATFFRCGRQPIPAPAVYKATEYIHIRFTSLIAQGATGSVHEGMLEAYYEDHCRCEVEFAGV